MLSINKIDKKTLCVLNSYWHISLICICHAVQCMFECRGIRIFVWAQFVRCILFGWWLMGRALKYVLNYVISQNRWNIHYHNRNAWTEATSNVAIISFEIWKTTTNQPNKHKSTHLTQWQRTHTHKYGRDDAHGAWMRLSSSSLSIITRSLIQNAQNNLYNAICECTN